MAVKRLIMNYMKREGMKLLKQKGIPIVKKQIKRRLGKKF